jgi:hypothetical protein
LISRSNARFWLVEAKASKTVQAAMAAPMLSLARVAKDRASRRIVVYRKPRSGAAFTAITHAEQMPSLSNSFQPKLTAAKPPEVSRKSKYQT